MSSSSAAYYRRRGRTVQTGHSDGKLYTVSGAHDSRLNFRLARADETTSDV